MPEERRCQFQLNNEVNNYRQNLITISYNQNTITTKYNRKLTAIDLTDFELFPLIFL